MVPHDWIEPPLLRGSSLQLWWRGVEAGGDGPELAELSGLLSDAEAERAGRFRFPKDRLAFEGRHVFVRRVLGQLTGRDPESLSFGEGMFGKPFLVGGGPAFNMSRSGAATLLATAGSEVGVDIEEVRPRGKLESVARRVQTADEQAQWKQLPEDERLAAFFRLWTRKEALMKVTGEGFQRDPASFRVGLEVRGWDEVLSCDLEGFGVAHLVDLPLPSPYLGALAIPAAAE
ncbi:MAG: 4'-phosphopantetheinyl transferase [Gammaproteobacteria bacterium]|jgi:4'-phosphopantetheinyl transferase